MICKEIDNMIISGNHESTFTTLYILSILFNIMCHILIQIFSNDVDNLKFHSQLLTVLQHIHDLHCYESSDDL